MNDNTGHGHVWARPDGVKARCGGPGLCTECSKDLARYQLIAGLVHSEEFVVMFLGFLTARIPELHKVNPPRLLDAWVQFKQEMGKSWNRLLTPRRTTMEETQVESEIKAKGLNAPRLTPEQIDSKIAAEDYHVFAGSQLTVCCLTLQNGFTVTGESACVSPENFNEELGRKIARGHARDKIWALEGYLLKQNLSESQDRVA